MATNPAVTGLQTIPLASIIPNVNNPRKHFDAAALKELAKSIESHGVRQPILVRPDPMGGKKYELIIGERRWRASKLAGKTDVPAIVDVLNDREALEVMVIENQQRQDVSPLEEARGYQALMNLGAEGDAPVHTAESVAAKIGKSVGYVYARLKLAALIPGAAEALDQGAITAGHAVLIARLQPLDQVKALLACFGCHFDSKVAFEPQNDKFADIIAIHDGFEPSLAPEKSLREWIQDNVNLKLKGVPWDLADENLVAAAGSCAKCPKRSESNPALFSELTIKGEDTCFDPVCFKEKREAFVQVEISKDRHFQKQREKSGDAPELLRQLSEQAGYTKPKPDQRVLKAGQWLPAKKAECDSVEEGLIVRGEHAGEKKLVCCNGACKVHKHSLSGGAPAAKAQPKVDQAEVELQEKIDDAWEAHQKQLLRSKVDGADRAALLAFLEFVRDQVYANVPAPKAFLKMPIHKAWSTLTIWLIEDSVSNDPFMHGNGGAIVKAFAEANKIDLAKVEKEFRVKQRDLLTKSVQTPAKAKKGK